MAGPSVGSSLPRGWDTNCKFSSAKEVSAPGDTAHSPLRNSLWLHQLSQLRFWDEAPSTGWSVGYRDMGLAVHGWSVGRGPAGPVLGGPASWLTDRDLSSCLPRGDGSKRASGSSSGHQPCAWGPHPHGLLASKHHPAGDSIPTQDIGGHPNI